MGQTSLNPSVGSIVVKNNSIISSGVTSNKGRPHAEFNALKSFDFEKYAPKVVIIEYNDPELISIEFHYQKLENIMK